MGAVGAVGAMGAVGVGVQVVRIGVGVGVGSTIEIGVARVGVEYWIWSRLHCTALHCNGMHRMALHCRVLPLHCTKVHYITLHYLTGCGNAMRLTATHRNGMQPNTTPTLCYVTLQNQHITAHCNTSQRHAMPCDTLVLIDFRRNTLHIVT